MNRSFNPIGLHRLLMHGRRAEILKIPRHGVDLKKIYENGDTVYHVVLKNRKLREEEIVKIFKMFHDRGANSAILNNYSKAPLHLAIECRMKNVVNFLMPHSSPLLQPPFEFARSFVDGENVKFWRTVKRNCGNLRSWNSVKIENTSASFFNCLVLKELDLNPENSRGNDLHLLLYWSIDYDLQHITLILLRLIPAKLVNTAHLNIPYFFRAFIQTIGTQRRRHNELPSKDWYSSYSSRYAPKIAKIFLENGATVDYNWWTHLYSIRGEKIDIGVIKLLVNHFSDNSVKHDFAKIFFKTMLEYPCADLSDSETRSYKQVLRDLVSRGAEVQCDCRYYSVGCSPMQLAAKAQNIPAVAFLKENGIDCSVKTSWGESLLHLIAESQSENQKMCEWLVNEGLDVNARDNAQRTPLYSAVQHENVAMVRKLIELGADVHCWDKDKHTPLHYAVIRNKSIEVAELLLQNGADVDAENTSDESPLILAIFPKVKSEMLKLLLNWGAQVNALFVDKDKMKSHNSRNYHLHYCMDDVKTLLNQHCLKFIAAGLLVTENCESPLKVTNNHQFYQECLKELETLKRTFINGSTSLYNFLHMNLDRKSLYVKNEELEKLVDSTKLAKKFPRYSNIILAGFRAGQMRNSLLERAKVAWMDLTEIYLPDICIERVLFYLSNGELANVSVMPQKKSLNATSNY